MNDFTQLSFILSCGLILIYFVDMFRWEISDFLNNIYAYTIYSTSYQECHCGQNNFIFVDFLQDVKSIK